MKKTDVAPICLFVYARPSHTEHVLRALADGPLAADSQLIVFSDGPKDETAAYNVERVRRTVAGFKGFKHIELIAHEENRGLSDSIVTGVSEVCQEFGSAIVVEDDVLVSPYFLSYMNDALTLYKDEARVCSVGGYMFPIAEQLPSQFFFEVTDCWGWATWWRSWQDLQTDGRRLLAEIERHGLQDRFNLGGAYDYLGMLKAQTRGQNDSWAVRWYATNLLRQRLTLYPGRSMTANIGNDGSGRHARNDRQYDVEVADRPLALKVMEVREDPVARARIGAYLRRHKPSLIYRARRRLSSLARRRGA